jgi:hypothetical protein
MNWATLFLPTRNFISARLLFMRHDLNWIKSNRGKTYKIYYQMISRCHNPNDIGYEDYGGRGIAVCNRWRNGFKYFLEDMGVRPGKMSIDRVDNNKGYSKDNCRWATHRQQCLNKRNSHILTHGGISMNITLWAERLNIDAQTLRWRIKSKWPIDEIFSPNLFSASFNRKRTVAAVRKENQNVVPEIFTSPSQ